MKQMFTLATTRCGYCKMTEQLIRSKYPDAGDKYIYFNADADKPDLLANKVMDFSKRLGIMGVPFTLLIEDGQITGKVIRGYNPKSLINMMGEIMDIEDSKGDGVQLEIPFDDE